MKTPDPKELSNEELTNSNMKMRLELAAATQEIMTQRSTIDDLTRENKELKEKLRVNLH